MCVERWRRAYGFTLLEVLVALAIAGLAFIGLFQAGSGGMKPTRREISSIGKAPDVACGRRV